MFCSGHKREIGKSSGGRYNINMCAKKNLFLICGDEEYLKEQKRAELLQKYQCEDSLNYNVFSEDNLDLNEIRGLLNTMPFLEEYRKIQISGSGFFKGTASEEVTELFSDVPESSIVLFYEKDADKSNALYKLVREKGEIFRFDTAESRYGADKKESKTEIRNWVKTMLSQAGRRIDSRTLFDLVETTGYDMQNLSTELEKLICYTLDRPKGYVMTKEDVNRICSRTLADRVFDMVDLKLRGKTAEALLILEELYAMKNAGMRILYVIVRQYNQALAFKECQQKRLSDAETASAMGIKNWLVDKLKKQTAAITREELLARLEDCADTELRIKRGDIPEKLGVELLLIR